MNYPDSVRIEPKLSDNAVKVLKKKYLRGETPAEMFWRVAEAIGRIEEQYYEGPVIQKEQHTMKFIHQFYNLMATLDFLPNSPTLMNAGRPLGQLSGCFVVPVVDSMESIADGIKSMMMIQKSGGGTGFSFSRLRPAGDPVTSTEGESSGPVSFMKAYNAVTDVVKQGGARRGANMGILRIDHPDILDFIDAKADLSQLTNFNMSVGITKEYMDAYFAGTLYELRFNGKVYAKLDAREVMDKMVYRAWCTGEPGFIFLDKINADNPVPALGEIESTNPCIIGDTLVKTVEGMIAIKELVGKEIDVYCVNDKYQLTIRKAKNIRLTRRNASLVKVATTKGDVICTPDHAFYTRNRGYVKACELQNTDKLVALNVAPKNQRYTKVYLTGTGANVPAEHIFIARHYYGDLTGKDVHHKDNDSKHNVYSNIEVIGHGNHSVISNKGHRDWMQHDPNTGRWIPNVKEDKDWSNKLGVHPVGVNMRLISVTPLNYTEDVYDMEVEECHNFFANHVLIHNCGEQPLMPYESCNLGSINVAHMLRQNFVWNPTVLENPWDAIDEGRLSDAVWLATRFLDNVIDANHYPLPEIEHATKRVRKIGLGIMGLADLLFQLRIPYDSEEGRIFAKRLMEFIQNSSHTASMELALQRGVFPVWEDSCWNIPGKFQIPMRNVATITIAPTGTLSVIAGVSSGIEPLFALWYQKDLKNGIVGEGSISVLNQHFMDCLIDEGFSEKQTEEILVEVRAKGTIQHYVSLSHSIDKIKAVFKISSDIHPLDHVRMQSAIQEFTDNAVSKTINFDNDVSPADIKEAIIEAYNSACKGVTVYRDGSRELQPLTKGNNSRNNKTSGEISPRNGGINGIQTISCSSCEFKQGAVLSVQDERATPMFLRERPEEVDGSTKKVRTGCGSLYITTNYTDDGLFEVLLDTGSTGGCSAFTEGTARLISLALRYGIPADAITKQLQSVRCDNFRHQTGKDNTLKGKSCPDVVGKAMLDKLQQLRKSILTKENDLINPAIIKTAQIPAVYCDEGLLENPHLEQAYKQKFVPLYGNNGKVYYAEADDGCPECGRQLNHSEGCVVCTCGFSRC
jgi:ribonucleoside-diphosphate reductase alpha chain